MNKTWEYRSPDELYHSTTELYHVGVPGMKWGKRSARPSTINAGRMITKKRQEQKNQQTRSNKNKLEYKTKLAKAKTDYKKQKSNIKIEKQKTLDDINKNTSLKSKMLYNDATRRRAAKLVVEKGLTQHQALSKVKRQAWRNSGIAAAAAIGVLAYKRKK